MYDRLGLMYSSDGLEWNNLDPVVAPDISSWCYASSKEDVGSGAWSASFSATNGGYGKEGGWILPSESSKPDAKGNSNVAGLGTWLKIQSRFVRFHFRSDSSMTMAGWDISLSRGLQVVGSSDVATIGDTLYIDKDDYTKTTTIFSTSSISVGTVVGTDSSNEGVYAKIKLT